MFAINFIEKHLLYSLFCLIVEHSTMAVLHLHCPNASAMEVLSKCKVQSAPESTIFSTLNDGKFLLSDLILLFLCCLKTSI
jgi:hypothetical protein